MSAAPIKRGDRPKVSDPVAIQAEAAAIRELMSHRTVSLATAGVALGVGRERIRSAVKAGDVPSIKLGREIRVPSAPLLRLLGLDVPPVEGGPDGPTEGS